MASFVTSGRPRARSGPFDPAEFRCVTVLLRDSAEFLDLYRTLLSYPRSPVSCTGRRAKGRPAADTTCSSDQMFEPPSTNTAMKMVSCVPPRGLMPDTLGRL